MKAHELLKEPGSWTTGVYARTKEGRTIGPLQPDAVCWCLSGALRKCYPTLDAETVIRVKIEQEIKTSLSAFNDAPNRTHAEVLAVLQKLDI